MANTDHVRKPRKPLRMLRGRPIRRRFFLAAICLCVIPLLLTAGIVFVTNYHGVTKQYLDFSRSMAIQMQGNLENRLLRLRADAIDLAYDHVIQTYVSESQAVLDQTGRSPVTEDAASAIVSKFGQDSDASTLLLFTRDGRCCYTYSNRSLHQLHLRHDFAQEVLSSIDQSSAGVWGFATPGEYEVTNSAGETIPFLSDEPMIFYSLKMKHLVGARYDGYLLLSARPDTLNEIFDNSALGNMTTVYLMDENGDTILSGNDTPLSDSVSSWLLPSVLSAKNDSPQVFSHGGPFVRDYAISTRIPGIGWYVVYVVDGTILSSTAFRSCRYILLLALVVLLMMIVVFSLLSNSISHPVNRILRGIRYVEQGNFQHRINDIGHDEFALIAASMDNMSARLQDMVMQIREQEQQHSETQIELLQMQINPHFINNTLNCVAGMASIQGEDNIARVVTSLASLLNQTLRAGREFVTLADELSYIHWYMDIQQYRGAFEYLLDIQIPTELMDCLLPPFTLEPLIENSVTHGTTQRRNSMTITIKGSQIGDVLQLIIIDNGCGMTPEQLELLNGSQAPHTDKLYRVHGIGVANVRKRLRLFFGEDYGLVYDSVPGQFTIATVTVPVMRKQASDSHLGGSIHVPTDDHR